MQSTIVPPNQDTQSASVFFALVISSAVHPLSVPALRELMLTGRACYRAANLTGILLYKDGNFMQLLEGAEADVRHMLTLSARDPRQILITPVLEGFAEERQYLSWTMAFPTVDSDDTRSTPGYSNFLNTPLANQVGASSLTNIQKLLLAFRLYVGSAL